MAELIPLTQDPVLIRRALDLKITGMTDAEIAEQLALEAGRSVSRQSVTVMLQSAQSVLTQPPDLIKARELMELDWVQAELRREWIRSCQPAVTETENEESTTRAGDKTSLTIVKKHQHGDPSVLRTLLCAMERRAALLGLDAPKRQHVLVEEHRKAVLAVISPALVAWCQARGIGEEAMIELAERLEGVVVEGAVVEGGAGAP